MKTTITVHLISHKTPFSDMGPFLDSEIYRQKFRSKENKLEL